MHALMPDPQHQRRLLQMITAAAHHGPAADDLLEELGKTLTPSFEQNLARSKGHAAKAAFKTGKSLAATIGETQARVDSYIDREAIREGKSGLFDSRSLGCWLAIAANAGIPSVPALPILEIPETLLELVIDPHLAEQEPVKRGGLFKFLDGISGGRLSSIFGNLDHIGKSDRQKLLALAQVMLRQAGEKIPAGAMVRHDHMGPNTLKAWACLGWEPWDGDEGVTFEQDGRRLTLGPGWAMAGNDRMVDVLDSRTTMAIAQALVDIHTFWARPWMKPARRYGGIDVTRPKEWPEDMRRGTWPAEWRVFIRGGKAVACSSYYPWADIPGDAKDQEMAQAAMDLAQKMADQATAQQALPDEVGLYFAHRRSEELRRMLPAGTVNATLDFLETDQGLMFLEGAMGNAHPCAFAGYRWPEGIKFRLDPGIDITRPETWGSR